jgi:uncharacterized protein YbjT (DUF2867 family)
MQAILLGATGLTGSYLLELLLNDSRFDKVIVFTRKKLTINHLKIEEHLVDLLDLSKEANLFQGDVVFCCIGTTKSKTPNREDYYKIDYGIPVEAARLAKQNGISKFIIVSALGANEKSRLFYNRIKGEMQRDVLSFNLPKTYILQPSLIIGDRKEKRVGENIAKVVMKAIDFITPDTYKAIHGKIIAKTMLVLTFNDFEKAIIPSDEIKKISNQYDSFEESK